METLQPLPSESQPAAGSLMSRLLNVFAAPAEVFDEIKSAKSSAANWLVPVLLGCLVGIIYSVVVFSQDNIMQSIREAQEQAIRGKFQKSVDAGKMSKEQVDQAVEMTQRFSGPTLMKVFGSFGAVVFNFGMVFLAGLVVWLVGAKAFKGQFNYMKAVETAGLAGMINVLGGLIAIPLAVMMGNMAMTPGPVLLVHEFNPANKLHILLSQINLVMLWYLAVLALGLARLSRVSFGKAAVCLFFIWAAFVALAVLPGWGR